MNALEKEFHYYLKHQDELVGKYNGRYIVIKEDQVIGDFDSEIEAYEEISKTHKLGTFLIQKCESGDESYTVTYHSRAYFNR